MIRQPVILTQTPKPNLPLIIMLLRFIVVIWDLIFLLFETNLATTTWTKWEELKVKSGCVRAVCVSMFVCLFACVCKTEGVTWVAWAACETKGMKRWWCLCQGHNDKACFFKAGGDRPLAELCLQGILCVCVCVCVLDSLVTRGGLMAIQGLCPFSWSMGLNLAWGGGGGGKEEEEEKKSRGGVQKWSGGCQTWQLLGGPDKYKPVLIGWKWKIPEWRAVFSFLSASRQRWPCPGGIDFQLCLRAPQRAGFDFIFNLFRLRSLDLCSTARWIC